MPCFSIMVQDMNWNFEIGYVLGTNHFEIKVCNQQSYEQSAGKFSNKMCIQEIGECMEEMGIKVSIKEFMAIGERYFYLESNNQYSHPIAHFYYCDEYEKVSEPLEKGSEYMWMNYKEAIKQLYHPHHSWAAEMIWDLAQKRRFS